MGFYDNHNFEGLKLISKIQTKKDSFISEPCIEVISILNQIKASNTHSSINVAEVGIGFGATSLQIIKILSKDDMYHCFDFEDKLMDFKSDLESGRFKFDCKVVLHGKRLFMTD